MMELATAEDQRSRSLRPNCYLRTRHLSGKVPRSFYTQSLNRRKTGGASPTANFLGRVRDIPIPANWTIKEI